MADLWESFRSSVLTSYPGKGVFTLLYIALNAVRLPFWLVYYIPSANRPCKDWSHRQAVRTRILRCIIFNMAVVEMKTPLNLNPGAEKARWAVVPAARPSCYTDVVSKDPATRPDSVGVTWWPKVPAKGAAGMGRVILHFHGGAYAIGDGRTADAGFAARTLHDNTDATHVACPQYRLSSNAGGRFPAQLQDAITCYAHLVNDLGISPSNIVLSGDSAGANLALALVRYIEDSGKAADLPRPSAALLWSIWVNPEAGLRLGHRLMDGVVNEPTDYITPQFGIWGARGMMPSAASGFTIQSPYISFGGNAFKTSVPIYMSIGECEVLMTDIQALAEQMAAVPGNVVKTQIEEHCIHDTILVGDKMGFEKEARQGARRAGAWLKDITKPTPTKL